MSRPGRRSPFIISYFNFLTAWILHRGRASAWFSVAGSSPRSPAQKPTPFDVLEPAYLAGAIDCCGAVASDRRHRMRPRKSPAAAIHRAVGIEHSNDMPGQGSSLPKN